MPLYVMFFDLRSAKLTGQKATGPLADVPPPPPLLPQLDQPVSCFSELKKKGGGGGGGG